MRILINPMPTVVSVEKAIKAKRCFTAKINNSFNFIIISWQHFIFLSGSSSFNWCIKCSLYGCRLLLANICISLKSLCNVNVNTEISDPCCRLRTLNNSWCRIWALSCVSSFVADVNRSDFGQFWVLPVTLNICTNLDTVDLEIQEFRSR